ncbi:polysaccharide deacetylase family protein [Cellulosimicrobium sp. CUA-896]|uniref:polysaccharide deacetylase family protein n=1 Tax=Cellulosimicrobium sp. CUA-896 TaxID=1517881 RepID=UPI000960481D|nr:polysaccharide deacetylase family protein [Cellulosimicrobium sp. CUA-896]OLT54548.1 hypothetical protein BJF88_08445 [Cellulosimicrobium sp. CUA-896]
MLTPNERMLYSPMAERPRVTWPEGKTVAFWHAPNVEHYDWLAPQGRRMAARVTPPDAEHYMHRDSGNRVAFWRMLRAVDRYAMPSTVSLSLALLQEQPEIRDAMLERDWEIMSHGISNLRPLYGMTPEEEHEFFATSQQLALTHYAGRPIKGMLGPRISSTYRTADIMVEHGMTYFADFVHDEHPRPILTESGKRLVTVPYTFTLNDVPAVLARSTPSSTSWTSRRRRWTACCATPRRTARDASCASPRTRSSWGSPTPPRTSRRSSTTCAATTASG